MARIEDLETTRPPQERDLKIEIEIMKAAGLDDAKIASLALLKQRVAGGQVDDLTMEHKRSQFLKHLFDLRIIKP